MRCYDSGGSVSLQAQQWLQVTNPSHCAWIQDPQVSIQSQNIHSEFRIITFYPKMLSYVAMLSRWKFLSTSRPLAFQHASPPDFKETAVEYENGRFGFLKMKRINLYFTLAPWDKANMAITLSFKFWGKGRWCLLQQMPLQALGGGAQPVY